MRIAHAAIATPRKCGLYETTRELVAAERALGVDARIVDPAPNEKVGIKNHDRGVPIADGHARADQPAAHGNAGTAGGSRWRCACQRSGSYGPG